MSEATFVAAKAASNTSREHASSTANGNIISTDIEQPRPAQLSRPTSFPTLPGYNGSRANGHHVNLLSPTNYFPTSVRSTHARRSSSSASSGSGEEKDAMGNVDRWGLRVGLLGTSSTASFMKQIETTVDGRRPSAKDRGARAAMSTHVTTTRTLRPKRRRKAGLHSAEYVLPPRKTADHCRWYSTAPFLSIEHIHSLMAHI